MIEVNSAVLVYPHCVRNTLPVSAFISLFNSRLSAASSQFFHLPLTYLFIYPYNFSGRIFLSACRCLSFILSAIRKLSLFSFSHKTLRLLFSMRYPPTSGVLFICCFLIDFLFYFITPFFKRTFAYCACSPVATIA